MFRKSGDHFSDKNMLQINRLDATIRCKRTGFRFNAERAMRSLVPAVLDNLHLTHDVVAAIREIGEGKGKQDLFQERTGGFGEPPAGGRL